MKKSLNKRLFFIELVNNNAFESYSYFLAFTIFKDMVFYF